MTLVWDVLLCYSHIVTSIASPASLALFFRHPWLGCCRCPIRRPTVNPNFKKKNPTKKASQARHHHTHTSPQKKNEKGCELQRRSSKKKSPCSPRHCPRACDFFDWHEARWLPSREEWSWKHTCPRCHGLWQLVLELPDRCPLITTIIIDAGRPVSISSVSPGFTPSTLSFACHPFFDFILLQGSFYPDISKRRSEITIHRYNVSRLFYSGGTELLRYFQSNCLSRTGPSPLRQLSHLSSISFNALLAPRRPLTSSLVNLLLLLHLFAAVEPF